MKTKQNLPPAGSLEDLLLSTLLENQAHPDYQKSIEMNATVLFSAATSISLPERTKNAFLANYPSFKTSWWTRKGFIQWIVGFVSITAIILYFVAMRNPIENTQISPDSNPMPGIVDTINHEKSDADQPRNSTPTHPISQKESFSDEKNSNLGEEKPENNLTTEAGKRPAVHLSGTGIGKMPEFDTKRGWDDTPYPDDGVEIKLSDYQLIAKKYIIHQTDSKPFYANPEKRSSRVAYPANAADSIKNFPPIPQDKPVYELHVYCGKPFKNLFKHMEFISLNPEPVEKPDNQILSDENPTEESSFTLPAPMFYGDIKKDGQLNKLDEEKLANLFFQPFYMMKTEVSNLDYKEFMYWVIRMNGFQAIERMNLDSLPKEAFQYQFHNPDNEYVKTNKSYVVDILPQRNVWTSDFPFSFNEPMDTYYLMHPAYSSYPVVGVSYWQALAYMDWLSWIWQSRLDARQIPYQIQFDLPTDYERELAIRSYLTQLENIRLQNSVNEQFFSSLAIKHVNDLELRMQLGIYSTDKLDEHFYTAPVAQSYFFPKSKTEMINLDGNVSEWCKDGYAENYAAWREKYIQLVAQDSTKGAELLLQMEEYFMQTCNKRSGKLVRGANFYDQRFTIGSQDQKGALYAKAFVAPNEQHSTIGFRAVVRVTIKKP